MACKTDEGNKVKDQTSKQEEDIRQSRNPLTKDRPLNRGRSREWGFEDEGYSGATLERPGLERVRDLAAEGQIQVTSSTRRID